MAEEDPILTSPATPEVARHIRDYSRFIQLLKGGALVSLITAFIVLLLIA